MRETQDEKTTGFGTVPPFWLRATDESGAPIDPRVREAAQALWPWAYRQVEALLHDAPCAAELLEEVAIDVSIRLQASPEVGANLKGYLRTSFHHRVRSQLLRINRLVHQGLVRELESAHQMQAPDWIRAIEADLSVQFLVAYLPHPVRHMLNRRLLGFSWREIGGSIGTSAKNARARFYYGVQSAYEALLRDVEERRREEESKK